MFVRAPGGAERSCIRAKTSGPGAVGIHINFLILLLAGIRCVYAQATWSATGPMQAPHEQHPATLLSNGKVLVVGTLACGPNCYSGAAAELFDPASGTWALATSPRLPRFNHIAEALPNGKALVAGGYLTPGVLTTTAELYDPVTETWSNTGSLTTPRQFHRSARLPNGQVLVAGGLGMDWQPVASAELYDPQSGRWSSANSMNFPRFGHSVTALADGRVLVVGGQSSNNASSQLLDSAEIYNPSTNIWSPVPPLGQAREAHRAVLLPSGQVLVAGGESAIDCLATAQLYDPVNNTWTSTGPMNSKRAIFTLTLLPSGKVLAAAGTDCSGALSSAEIYDPNTGTWSAAGNLVHSRWFQSATVLLNGKVLIAGGEDSSDQASVQKGIAEAEVFGISELSQGSVVTTSAASLTDNGAVAPESLAAAFGIGFTTAPQVASGPALPLSLAGVSVSVVDSNGSARQAPLLAVTSTQINFEIPAGTASGNANVAVLQNGSVIEQGKVLVAPIAPGVFAADGSGEGLPVAQVVRIRPDGTQSYEAVAQFDSARNQYVPVPIDLSPGSGTAFLTLYGTGIRSRSAASAVTVAIGTAVIPASFAGPNPQFPGVDQVNLQLPGSLAGSGAVDVLLSVDGFLANVVRLTIR